MKDLLKEIRATEEALRSASPAKSGKLAKKLVALKDELMGR